MRTSPHAGATCRSLKTTGPPRASLYTRATEWWRLSIRSGWLPGPSTTRPVGRAPGIESPPPELDSGEPEPFARTDRAGSVADEPAGAPVAPGGGGGEGWGEGAVDDGEGGEGGGGGG